MRQHNSGNSGKNPAGAGLVLSRNVGERIYLQALPGATDQELAAAIRKGIIITLVSAKGGHASEKGSVRFGFKCGQAIAIAREELQANEPEIAQAYQ